MDQLPKDPVILLSYVNTRLRDFYPSLDAFCRDLDVERDDVETALRAIGYEYDSGENRFR